MFYSFAQKRLSPRALGVSSPARPSFFAFSLFPYSFRFFLFLFAFIFSRFSVRWNHLPFMAVDSLSVFDCVNFINCCKSLFVSVFNSAFSCKRDLDRSSKFRVPRYVWILLSTMSVAYILIPNCREVSLVIQMNAAMSIEKRLSTGSPSQLVVCDMWATMYTAVVWQR